MSIMTVKGLIGALVLASVGLVVSACNTSKATVDTFAKFTSSTSPGDWINADGVIQESQKARLFAAVTFENLEQDIARGNGEYLRSLAVLMKIPASEQDEFRSLSQKQYSRLFASDQRTAESMLTTLTNNRKDR
jgi:ssDNA-specific exonuclease RecJ